MNDHACYRPGCDVPAGSSARLTPRNTRIGVPGRSLARVRLPRCGRVDVRVPGVVLSTAAGVPIGFLGWLADRWLGTSFLVVIGILLGAGLGIYLTIKRFDALPNWRKAPEDEK